MTHLPSIDDWFDYIDKPVTSWANVTAAEGLQSEPSVLRTLREFDNSPWWSFWRECQFCLCQFSSCPITQLPECGYAVGGNADYIVELFQDPVACFQQAGYLNDLDREASVTWLETLVVDRLFAGWWCVWVFGEQWSYQSRANVKHISSCPGRCVPGSQCNAHQWLPKTVFRSDLGVVQSFVLHPNFMASDLLTVGCLKELKVKLPAGHQSLACSEFDPWAGVSRHPREDIYASLLECYATYCSWQVEDWRARISIVEIGSVVISYVGQTASGSSSTMRKGNKRVPS